MHSSIKKITSHRVIHKRLEASDDVRVYRRIDAVPVPRRSHNGLRSVLLRMKVKKIIEKNIFYYYFIEKYFKKL